MPRSLLSHALRWLSLALLASWLVGCASTPASTAPASSATTPPPATARALPRSIVVLPPLNHSPDVQASASVLAQATVPLADAGYYVIPVTLMTETFRQNGLEVPEDIHAISPRQLRRIFGADAALYIEVMDYGARYKVVASETAVRLQGKLVDLRNGRTLWQGEGRASNEVGMSSSRNLSTQLVAVLLTQVVSSVTDAAHTVAGTATERMLAPGTRRGLAYGHRSPMFGQ